VPLARLYNVLVAAKVLEQSLPRINIPRDVPTARLYNVMGHVNNPNSHRTLRNNRNPVHHIHDRSAAALFLHLNGMINRETRETVLKAAENFPGNRAQFGSPIIGGNAIAAILSQ
jgi:hypothetical protein